MSNGAVTIGAVTALWEHRIERLQIAVGAWVGALPYAHDNPRTLRQRARFAALWIARIIGTCESLMLAFKRFFIQIGNRITNRGPQGFLRNVLQMFAGNLAAQILGLLAYPLLARIYAPGQLGVLAFMTSATVISIPLLALRYERALPLASSAQEAGNILVVCFAVLFGMVTLSFVVLFLLPTSIVLRFDVISRYRMFISLAFIPTGSYAILIHEATRQARFSEIARTRIYQALNGPIVQIILGGLFHAGIFGLLTGFLIGQSAGTIGLIRRLLIGHRSPLNGVNLRSAWAAAVKHRRFPLYASWSGVFGASASIFMILTFPLLYGPEVGGLLFLADRVLARPLQLLTMSVFHVFMMESGKVAAEAPQNLRALFLDITVKQFGISAVWIGAIVLSAPYVVPVIFGQQWALAPVYLRYMAIAFFPGSIVSTVLYSLQALGKQKLAAMLDISRTSSIFVALLTAYSFGVGPANAVLICSLIQATAQVVVFTVIYRAVDQASKNARLARGTL